MFSIVVCSLLHCFLRLNYIINIISDNTDVINHFSNRNNFTNSILHTFNNDRFYDIYFEGWEDIVVLDIGANIGLFSLYIQDRAKIVYAIEPTPSHFKVLEELTERYSNIIPVNVALHSSNDFLNFYINAENSTTNSSVKSAHDVEIQVSGLTISKLIKKLQLNYVDFIKCDIEGSEMNSLTYNLVHEVRDIVKVWSIEVHTTDKSVDWNIGINQNRDILEDIFKRNGYNVFKYRTDVLYAYKGL